MSEINWNDAENAIVKLFVGYDVEAYVDEYEFCGDDGDYTPNEAEKGLLTDAIYGVVADLHEKMRVLMPSSPSDNKCALIETLSNALETISNMRGTNPSLAYAVVPEADYLKHVLYEARQVARKALSYAKEQSA